VKPLGITMKNWVETGGARLDKIIDIFDDYKRKEKPLEKHAMDYHKGTLNSITMEAAKYVLERSMEQSKEDPNLFKTSRDGRLSIDFYYSFPNEFLFEIAKHIKCEFYAIRPERPLLYESIKLAYEAEKILKKSAKKFELVEVKGTHHVHLDHPERIFDHVMRWLKSE